jgi:sec-independent protein translocase protein TatA
MEMMFLFIQKMGPWGIVLIVLVILLLFGGKKIPELMKGLGKGMKEFKKASKGEVDSTSDIEKKD